jgi:DNA-binding transcriptional LysR family regulator
MDQINASDLELLHLLLAAGTLTAAARRLWVEQSTLTRQLLQLEEKLGQSLFSRHRSGLVPTQKAIELKSWADQL